MKKDGFCLGVNGYFMQEEGDAAYSLPFHGMTKRSRTCMGVYPLHKGVCESHWSGWKQSYRSRCFSHPVGRNQSFLITGKKSIKSSKPASHWFLCHSQSVAEAERSCDSWASIFFLGISQLHTTLHVRREADCISSPSLNSVVINCSKCQIHKKSLVNLEKKNNSVSGVYWHFVMNRGVDRCRYTHSIC